MKVKKLLSLFDHLKIIFNETVNKSNINTKNESDSESDYNSDNEDENEGEKYKYYYEIRQLNNWFETIDQTKSLEEQIELLQEKGELLAEYWYGKYYHDNTELNYKIFKAKAAHLLIDFDEQLFEKIFGHKFAALVDKLINTTSKEENQIIIDDIENNSSKVIEQEYSQFIIKPAYKRSDLKDAIKIILEINDLLTSDKVNND